MGHYERGISVCSWGWGSGIAGCNYGPARRQGKKEREEGMKKPDKRKMKEWYIIRKEIDKELKVLKCIEKYGKETIYTYGDGEEDAWPFETFQEAVTVAENDRVRGEVLRIERKRAKAEQKTGVTGA